MIHGGGGRSKGNSFKNVRKAFALCCGDALLKETIYAFGYGENNSVHFLCLKACENIITQRKERMNGLANFNIIGNGFDLYHGLPTSYYYFACYLLAKNEDIYDDWAEMYGFSRGIMHMPFEDLERRIDNKGYWSNFEKSLGYISSEWVENSLLDDLDLENPEAVDLPIERPNHVAEIKQMLNDWIRETVDTDHNFEVVNQLIGAKKLDISASDAFLSFN